MIFPRAAIYLQMIQYISREEAIALIEESVSIGVELDRKRSHIATKVPLIRPLFFKIFRAMIGTMFSGDAGFKSKQLDQFVIYVRIVDNAGNVTFIGSDGATFDTTAPEIVGVIDGSTYYVTKKVAIDDENLELVTLNGKSVKDVFTLAGDKESAYIIRAVDKAGNLTESERAALGRVDALAEKIKKLAEDEISPKTEDTRNLALWIALLFINGGIVTGTTVVSKKKRRSEN